MSATNVLARLKSLYDEMFRGLDVTNRRLGLVGTIGSRIHLLRGAATSTRLLPAGTLTATSEPALAALVARSQLGALDYTLQGIQTELAQLNTLSKQQERLCRELRSMHLKKQATKLRCLQSGLDIPVAQALETANLLHQYCVDLVKVLAVIMSSITYSTTGSGFSQKAAAFADMCSTARSKLQPRLMQLD
jgi:hypothetical protein